MSGPCNTIPEQYNWHNPSGPLNSNAELALANITIVPLFVPGNWASVGSD
jgi:hypothetical protein